jgi:hypothetical protein
VLLTLPLHDDACGAVRERAKHRPDLYMRPPAASRRGNVALVELCGDGIEARGAGLRMIGSTLAANRLAFAFSAAVPRFMEQGVDGLLRDKTRKPGKPPLACRLVSVFGRKMPPRSNVGDASFRPVPGSWVAKAVALD